MRRRDDAATAGAARATPEPRPIAKSSWRAPTLKSLRQSLGASPRRQPADDDVPAVGANEIREALDLDAAAAAAAAPAVAHVRQRHVWDCGLACLLMVAPCASGIGEGASWDVVNAACGTKSVWTVDLAFVLRELGARFLFLTKTCGADPSYARLAFYSRELGTDSGRVSALFSRAAAGEVALRRAVVGRDALLEVLRTGRCLAIALVDLRLLRRSALSAARSYTGHYVVLVGVEGARVRYRDPAEKAAELWIHKDDLHRARTAHGTDEDLLLVAVAGPGDAPAARWTDGAGFG